MEHDATKENGRPATDYEVLPACSSIQERDGKFVLLSHYHDFDGTPLEEEFVVIKCDSFHDALVQQVYFELSGVIPALVADAGNRWGRFHEDGLIDLSQLLRGVLDEEVETILNGVV